MSAFAKGIAQETGLGARLPCYLPPLAGRPPLLREGMNSQRRREADARAANHRAGVLELVRLRRQELLRELARIDEWLIREEA